MSNLKTYAAKLADISTALNGACNSDEIMKRNRKIKKSNIVLLCLIVAYFACETIEFATGYKLITHVTQ
ncbi:MAG: hypothetical protein LBV41_03940 [Cytophagaceae bacterium]|jgi:hypothetical protein|nr:hypothetical protein [Cytophagaceae bacterium]